MLCNTGKQTGLQTKGRKKYSKTDKYNYFKIFKTRNNEYWRDNMPLKKKLFYSVNIGTIPRFISGKNLNSSI